MSPFTIFACGHSCIAILIGMAERTPKYRASYEHDATTPLSPPPTIRGISFKFGFSNLTQETKKVSKSMCTIERDILFWVLLIKLFYKIRTILPNIIIFVVNYITINTCLYFLITLGTYVSKVT